MFNNNFRPNYSSTLKILKLGEGKIEIRPNTLYRSKQNIIDLPQNCPRFIRSNTSEHKYIQPT